MNKEYFISKWSSYWDYPTGPDYETTLEFSNDLLNVIDTQTSELKAEIERLKSESDSFQDYVRSYIRTKGLSSEWEKYLLANPKELPKYYSPQEFEDL